MSSYVWLRDSTGRSKRAYKAMNNGYMVIKIIEDGPCSVKIWKGDFASVKSHWSTNIPYWPTREDLVKLKELETFFRTFQ